MIEYSIRIMHRDKYIEMVKNLNEDRDMESDYGG